MDILDFFRGVRPFSQLLRLVTRLPNHSLYQASLLDDDDYARRHQASGAQPPRQTTAGYTPEVSALYDIADWIKALIATTYVMHGADPPVLPPSPRPRTAFDRVRDSSTFDRHKARVAKMIGG